MVEIRNLEEFVQMYNNSARERGGYDIRIHRGSRMGLFHPERPNKPDFELGVEFRDGVGYFTDMGEGGKSFMYDSNQTLRNFESGLMDSLEGLYVFSGHHINRNRAPKYFASRDNARK